MKLFKMAWRNIWRNKLRSMAVILAVMLGLLAGIFSSALVNGIMDGRFENFIESEISHIQVHHPDFIGQQEIFQTVGSNPSVLSDVLALEGVKSATVRTKIQCMIASATYTGGIRLLGILPEYEDQTTGFSENIVAGSYLEPGDGNSILIGKAMADKMRVREGSRIVLTFQNINNDIINAAFVVKGIYETYYKRYDESFAFVNLDYLNEHLEIGKDFHELALLANHFDHLEQLVPELQSLFPDSKVRKWNEVSPELNLWVEVGGIFSYIFITVILIGLAFGLLNTMLMAVFERTRELGMLMAIGMNKKRIFSLIVSETLLLSAAGAVVGMVLAYWLVMTTSVNGIDLSGLSDVMKEIGFDTIIYPELDQQFFWLLPVFVIITAVLAAIYPAIKALQLNPAEAIRK